MKSILESLRAARHIEVILLAVLIAALGLWMLGSANREPAGTDVEARLERLIERIGGVGDVDVMISTDEDGHPVGAAVVAGGSLDVRTTLEIQSAIQALLDIDLQRIRIISRGGLIG